MLGGLGLWLFLQTVGVFAVVTSFILVILFSGVLQ